jgi:hypothetical protein
MALIGISGKIGSGKDTIGKIIQIIVSSPHFTNKAVADFLNREVLSSSFKIRKFADSLKDMVCILLGCTREQLESQEFKETPLGEEWIKYRIITKGDYPYYVSTQEEAANICFKYPQTKRYVKETLTPRLLLQLLGTECGREILHPNIWVNALFSKYINKELSREELISLAGEKGYEVLNNDWTEISTKELEDRLSNHYVKKSNWIITDMRFPNELEAVRKKGGITIKVIRGSMSMVELANQHESETALDNYDCKHTIYNNDTIEDLIENVRQVLIEEKII